MEAMRTVDIAILVGAWHGWCRNFARTSRSRKSLRSWWLSELSTGKESTEGWKNERVKEHDVRMMESLSEKSEGVKKKENREARENL